MHMALSWGRGQGLVCDHMGWSCQPAWVTWDLDHTFHGITWGVPWARSRSVVRDITDIKQDQRVRIHGIGTRQWSELAWEGGGGG